MARGPLTEEEVIADSRVLNLETVGLSDEQFFQLCLDNRELHLELTAQKELVIMTLPGGKTGRRNEIICRRLRNWAEQDGTGITFVPLTLFILPNGAKRAPDASWLRRERWDSLTAEQQEKAPPLCPDFVVELVEPELGARRIDVRAGYGAAFPARIEDRSMNARMGASGTCYQRRGP